MTGAARPRVVHLGRAGEVPGGMTQVVNGYLGWTFPDVDVEVLTSRGAPHDHRTAALAAGRALLAVLRMPRAGTVLVAHLSERGSFLREGTLLRVARARGIATVAHLHGASFAVFEARHPRLTRSVLRAADRVIALSEESRAISARHVAAERVVVIPNAIPAGTPREKEDLVVFGGAVCRRKGVDVLTAAWRRVHAPGWRLVVAGPVEDADLVAEQVPGVDFTGPVAHAELMELLERSRVAVLPSREEAMPMFLLEAMARRNAVVSTAVGGVPALLDHGRGVVVPPGDVDALVAAFREVLDDDPARERLAAAAETGHAEGFSAAGVFPRVQALWLSALTEAAAR